MKSTRRNCNQSRLRKLTRQIEPYYQASYREIQHDLKLIDVPTSKKETPKLEESLPLKRPRPVVIRETIEETHALEVLATLIDKTEKPKTQTPSQKVPNLQTIEAYQRANMMKMSLYYSQYMMYWQNYYMSMSYYGGPVKKLQTEMTARACNEAVFNKVL